MSNSVFGLLVGAGSVGKRHAKVMASRYEKLFIVDPSPEARGWCNSTFGTKCVTFETLDDATPSLVDCSHSSTAVIANWGTLHHATFKAIAELGITRVFVEKPLAHSLAAIEEMCHIASMRNMSVGVGHQRRYCGIMEHIRDQAMAVCGGDAVQIIVHGGAKCLVTQGMHWIDFAHGLFGDNPVAVHSRMTLQEINPRSPKLGHWEGFIHLVFPGERFLTISYSAKSSVEESVTVYGPVGVANISSELGVDTHVRNLAEVDADPRVTRVGSVSTEPTQLWQISDPTTLQIQLDEIDRGHSPKFGIGEASRSASSMLSALIASSRGGWLQLPVMPDDKDWNTEWPVS